MSDISAKEQKRLMLEARAARRVADQNVAKSDLSDLETWLLKKRKIILNKSTPNVLESLPSTLLPSKSSCPRSPKKMKTLMSDEVRRTDWEISSLICATGGSD